MSHARAVCLRFAMAGALGSGVGASALAGPSFTDVTSQAGVSYVQDGGRSNPMSGGAAVADYDGDGWQDLYVTRFHDHDLLFRNRGTDPATGQHRGFTDVTSQACYRNAMSAASMCAARA